MREHKVVAALTSPHYEGHDYEEDNGELGQGNSLNDNQHASPLSS